MVTPTLSVVVVILAGQAGGTTSAVPDGCAGASRRVDVGTGLEPVCLIPGESVTLRFDAPFRGERTVVEGEGVYLAVGEKHVSLDASPDLVPGERRRLTVYFADGLEPASVSFDLVARPDSQLRSVNVNRLPRTAASLRQEVEELRRRVAVCEARGEVRPVAEVETVLPRLLAQEESGLPIPWVKLQTAPAPGFKGKVVFVHTYLHPGKEGLSEAAVDVRLVDKAGATWTVEEAQLESKDGEPLAGVRMFGPSVVQALSLGRLRVVVAPSERVVPGTYKLRLKGGGRELVLENVTFK